MNTNMNNGWNINMNTGGNVYGNNGWPNQMNGNN